MARNPDSTTALVYSTEHGTICPSCSKPQAKCICKQRLSIVKGDGNVRVSLETKGRHGKGVTIITGLPVSIEELKEIAKKLKQKCGTGGTVKNGSIEIQGDHRTILIGELEGQGYKVKRSGG